MRKKRIWALECFFAPAPVFYWLKFTPLSVIDPVPVTVQVRFAPVKEVSVSEYDPMSMDAGCTHTSRSAVQSAVRITASLLLGRRLAWTLTSFGAQFSKLTNRLSSRLTNLTGFVSPTKNPKTCLHEWSSGSLEPFRHQWEATPDSNRESRFQ